MLKIKNNANTELDNANMENAHEGFKSIVDRCAKRESNRVIPNSATCHATYLLYKLLESAVKPKHPVRIISGELKMSVYNQLVEILEKCMKAGVKMQVVVLDGVENPNGENKFYEQLHTYDKATCYEPNKANPKDIAGKTPHMLMVGDRGYRYETNTKTHSARANFNNPDFVWNLNNFFNGLIESDAVSQIKRKQP